jgi:hypothetical protein
MDSFRNASSFLRTVLCSCCIRLVREFLTNGGKLLLTPISSTFFRTTPNNIMASNDKTSPKSIPEEIPDSQESVSPGQMQSFGSAASTPAAFAFDFQAPPAPKEVPRPDVEPVGKSLLLSVQSLTSVYSAQPRRSRFKRG